MRYGMAGLATAIALGVASAASADEHLQTLAASGNWVAFAHSESMISTPDVCAAANLVQHVLFRASADSTEFRVINDKWSLPADVKGQISVSVGPFSKAFDIVENSDKWAAAAVTQDDLVPLFAAMDKAASMSVTVGNDKPFTVSLSGSTKATNAFRTCAGIHSNAASPGSNPFE